LISDPIDATNPVVALCAAGMAHDGPPGDALVFFERAWAERRDDFEACVAAHYLARVQPTAAAVLHWHSVAVQHAEAATDDRRVDPLRASLYLNLGDALLAAGRADKASLAVARAGSALGALPADGYRAFIAAGVRRLRERLDRVTDEAPGR